MNKYALSIFSLLFLVLAGLMIRSTMLPGEFEQTSQVAFYVYNPALDQGPGGAQCSQAGLVPLERTIPKTKTSLAEAVNLLLLSNISSEERKLGLQSEFPLLGVTLTNAVITDGVAILTFSDPQNMTGGGSCRVSILRAQIEATARQFKEVQSVQILPEELFQP